METPVVLFVFNRPALTRDALQRLAAVRPEHLLVVADGPRHADDEPLCRETREAVRRGISWQARVDFLESADNLGCRRRFESGLDWVFDRVERAVILEDDIEVTSSFFDFASDSLEQFADRHDVRMISGRNVLIEYPDEPVPFLSRYGSIWAWATWADRWQRYRREFSLSDADSIRDGIGRYAVFDVQKRLQQHLLDTRLWERIDTWDIPWSLWNLATGGYCLNAPRNLAANLGMNPDATHTKDADDVRGAYPLCSWIPAAVDPHAVPIHEEYDRLVTLLEMILNYEHPRRWKVLAHQHNRHPRHTKGPGWEVMLGPFDHPEETSKLILALKRWIKSPQLDRLGEIFPAT